MKRLMLLWTCIVYECNHGLNFAVLFHTYQPSQFRRDSPEYQCPAPMSRFCSWLSRFNWQSALYRIIAWAWLLMTSCSYNAVKVIINALKSRMASSEGPPPKRYKRECKYQTEWKKCGVSASKRGPQYAYCDNCRTDIGIGHGWFNDVKKHLSTRKHQEMVRGSNRSRDITTLFAQSTIEESVTYKMRFFLQILWLNIISLFILLITLPTLHQLCFQTARLLNHSGQLIQKQLVL